MCDGCRSLNDMPANKCYKCRAPRPASPTLLDDQYGQVSDKPRVGVSVELSRVAELAARDPRETQKSAGVFEAFTAQDDQPIESARTTDPAFTTGAAAGMGTAGNKPKPPPIREPVKRGISELGGQDWRIGVPPASESVAPSGGSAPQPSPPGGAVLTRRRVHRAHRRCHRRQRQQARHMARHPWDRRLESRRCRTAPCRAGRSRRVPPGGPMPPAPGMAPPPPGPGSTPFPPRPNTWSPGPPVAPPRPGGPPTPAGPPPPGGPPPPASAPGPTMPREKEGDGSPG